MGGWPDGWSIERVRDLGWGQVEELPLDDVFVVVQVAPNGLRTNDYEPVIPQLILRFGNYCLVRPVDEDEWIMGSFDPADSSIACWGTVGDDLEKAIHGL